MYERFFGGCMIIAFCGHSDYVSNSMDEKKIMGILEERVKGNHSEFFLGGYGGFDSFAYSCAKKFKLYHPESSLIFITPYISTQYQNRHLQYKREEYDQIIYPELEKVPPRYAILHRNKWIVDKADIIISYIDRQYGGAYKMYEYAKRKNKNIYNIGALE